MKVVLVDYGLSNAEGGDIRVYCTLGAARSALRKHGFGREDGDTGNTERWVRQGHADEEAWVMPRAVRQ